MNIRELLKQNRPVLFDGAMGTWFAAQPGCAGLRCEQANVDAPEQILSIHRAYLAAGAAALKTNTFGLSAELALGGDQALQWLRAGAALAQEAAEPSGAAVFADLGPAPAGADAAEIYWLQAREFLKLGLRCFLLETLPSDEGVAELARRLKQQAPEAFLLVSFAVGPDGVTCEGRSGRALYARAQALDGVDAVGFNCVCGPQHMLRLLRTLPAGEKPLSVMPNAGYPTVLGRRTVYQGTPEYFGERLAQLAAAGAAILGGCCGTTPAHIAAAEAALRQPMAPVIPAAAAAERPRRAGTNALRDKLRAGQRVIAVELDPPADDDIAPFLEGVQTLRQAGADAITIADCPVGRPRADSSLLACKLKRELGVEPLPHMTCRDRNLNAIKALLLGLCMEDVHNVLLVTGDPIPTAERDAVKSVFNFNSRKLAAFVRELNETVFSTPFQIFGALNLNAANFAVQLQLAQRKEECGVTGFLTQPVLSARALENLKQARQTLQGVILGGVYPVVSHRNACFLNNEISGMDVSPDIVRRYEGKTREEAEALAVEISTQIARAIAPYTDGLYLMTPFRRVGLICKILAQLEPAGQ